MLTSRTLLCKVKKKKKSPASTHLQCTRCSMYPYTQLKSNSHLHHMHITQDSFPLMLSGLTRTRCFTFCFKAFFSFFLSGGQQWGKGWEKIAKWQRTKLRNRSTSQHRSSIPRLHKGNSGFDRRHKERNQILESTENLFYAGRNFSRRTLDSNQAFQIENNL